MEWVRSSLRMGCVGRGLGANDAASYPQKVDFAAVAGPGSGADGEESGSDSFRYLLVDFVDGKVALDTDDAVWLAGGNLSVFFPDATEELVLFGFETALVFAGLLFRAGVAAAGANEGGRETGEKEDGEVWLEVTADKAMEVEHYIGTQLAATTLVGLGGVCESVAEKDAASGEGGLNDLSDGLGAIGKHQGHLCHGSEACGAGVEEDFADPVAGGGSAGLAGEDKGHLSMIARTTLVRTTLLKPVGEASDLGGFSGAVKALKCNE